jgi:hypothetical protein
VLVAHSSSSPDGFTVADQVLNATTRLGVLLALVHDQVGDDIDSYRARVAA